MKNKLKKAKSISEEKIVFSEFSKWMSKELGLSTTFVLAILLILVWLATGPLFNFSDTWQLIINTATTIITFLMVFVIQNTQNRDTTAIHLKLDEIIRAMQNTHNELLKVEELSDEELDTLLKRYENLANDIKCRMKKGQSDKGTPDLKQ